jgi:hypothetical protein
MRFPQVSDRVKEAPAQALRGVFASIGQLLLFTDKLKNKDKSKAVPAQRVPPPRARSVPSPASPGALPAADPALAVPEPILAVPEPILAAPGPSAADTPPPASSSRPQAEDAAAVPGEAAAAGEPVRPAPEAGLPLANYDELSLASLRGRLRTLDAAQLRQLVSYEREHAARADVLAMFERRITKLETGA